MALVALAYARTLGNGFSYDEGLVIVRAQQFLRSGSFGTLLSKNYFAASLEGTWRPFCTLTYMIDAMVGLSPAVFHATSLAWHAGAALLLMALVRRLLPPQQARFALVAGLVFALHPVMTEAVDNASFREDSLVTFWTLAALLLALRGRQVGAVAAFLLALLSKESGIVMPALLAGVRLARPRDERPPLRAVVRELIPYGAVAVVYLAVRFGPMEIPIHYARYPGGTLAGTLLGMPVVWAHYLRLLVVPWPLCADYTGYFRFGPQPAGPVLVALALDLAFGAAIVVAARRGRLVLAFGLAWFALALAPVSNFIPVPIPAAERFLYLPLAGLALAAAAVAAELADRWPAQRLRAAAAAGVAALAVFVTLINVRHRAWVDDQTLWLATVRVNPRACGAQSAVGGNFLSRGIAEQSPDLLRAAAAKQELALRLCGDDGDPTRAATAYTRLGAARAMLGDLPAARAALERAMHLWPRYALPVVWLGYVRFLEGDRQAAADLLKRAVIDLGPPDSSVAEVAQRYLDKV